MTLRVDLTGASDGRQARLSLGLETELRPLLILITPNWELLSENESIHLPFVWAVIRSVQRQMCVLERVSNPQQSSRGGDCRHMLTVAFYIE